MKGFHFRLESLVPLRESSRDKALGDYAAALKKRVDAESVLAEAKVRLLEYEDKLIAQAADSFSAGQRQSWSTIIANGRSSLKKMEIIIDQLRNVEGKKLSVLLRTKKELDVVLKLKEKKKKKFILDQQHKEERELEDIINARRPS